jgi:hypothetical protein
LKIKEIKDVDYGPKKISSNEELKKYTLMFELIGGPNRIVVRYPEIDLILLGARNNITGIEITPEEAKEKWHLPFDIPRIYDLHSYEDIKTLTETFKNDQEGIVVCDKNFNRVKIKGDAYLSIHRLKDANGNFTSKRLYECIQTGVIDDIRSNFPEYEEMVKGIFEEVKYTKNLLRGNLQYLFDILADPAMRRYDEKRRKKEYAQIVMSSSNLKPISDLCFDWYKEVESGNIVSPENAIEKWMKKLDYEGLRKVYSALKN